MAGVGGPGRSVYQIIIADSSVAGGANVFPLTLALNSGRFHVRKQSARHVPPTHTADFPGRTLAVGEKKKKKPSQTEVVFTFVTLSSLLELCVEVYIV